MERQSKWAKVTPKLLFACFCFLVGDMLFGFDTGSFGGLLANPVRNVFSFPKPSLRIRLYLATLKRAETFAKYDVWRRSSRVS